MFSGKGSTNPKADPKSIGQERFKVHVQSIDLTKYQASFSRLKKLFEMDCIPGCIKYVNQCTSHQRLTYMKKFLDSDWLRAVQFKCALEQKV